MQYYVDSACCYSRSSVVCLSADLSVTIVSPAKTAEPIEMLFGKWTRVGIRKYVQYYMGVYIGATWRMLLNRPRAVAMWSYVITLTTSNL